MVSWQDNLKDIFSRRTRTQRKFISFLKANDCYDKYLNNIRGQLTLNEIFEERCWDWICMAFVFSCTPEGDDFWLKINALWDYEICVS